MSAKTLTTPAKRNSGSAARHAPEVVAAARKWFVAGHPAEVVAAAVGAQFRVPMSKHTILKWSRTGEWMRLRVEARRQSGEKVASAVADQLADATKSHLELARSLQTVAGRELEAMAEGTKKVKYAGIGELAEALTKAVKLERSIRTGQEQEPPLGASINLQMIAIIISEEVPDARTVERIALRVAAIPGALPALGLPAPADGGNGFTTPPAR